MGNVSSSELNQVMQEFTDYCNKTSLSNYANVRLQCTSQNRVTLTTGGSKQCGSDASSFRCYPGTCGINIAQTASTVCSAEGQTTSELSSNVSHDITTTMDGFIDQLSSTESEIFQTAFNATTTSIKSFQDMETHISNTVELNSTTLCQGQADAVNSDNILLCGTYSGTVNIQQNAATQLVASCINSAVLNAFETDTELNTFIQEMDSALNTKGGGLGFLSSPWFWIIMAVVIIVIVVILVMIFKPKKQPVPPPAAAGGQVIMVPKAAAPPKAAPAVVPVATAPPPAVQVVAATPIKVQVRAPTSPK